MPVHVALLRGFNVGGKNKLPMIELVRIFEHLGCTDVSTYIQSGNVIFSTGAALARRIPERVSLEIAERWAYRVPVVLRRGSELLEAFTGNPLLKPGTDTKMLSVGFLTTRPSSTRVRGLDPDRSPGDAFEVRGREIYLHCPNGAARTKLTNAYFDAKLKTISTFRNWATVRKLVDLASG